MTAYVLSGKRSRYGWLCAWAAFVGALAAWAILLQADSHWLGTLVAFGPRWVLLAPLGLLAIPATAWQRRALVPLGLAAAVIAGPVMGFCVPWRTWARGQESGVRSQGPGAGGQGAAGTRIKVLTCNTQGARAEEGLKGLIAREQPDVFVLQEWPSQRPALVNAEDGWEIARAGGILVASRLPILASERLVSPARKWHVIGLRCEVAVAEETVQFFGLHLLTPREGLQAVLDEGLNGLDELAEVTAERVADGIAVERWMDEHSGPKLVAGDFNMPPESVIYRRRFGHLQNAFSTAGWGYGGTKHTRFHSVRIDHVLADEQWRVISCQVGPDVGSDHRPVVAEITLKP